MVMKGVSEGTLDFYRRYLCKICPILMIENNFDVDLGLPMTFWVGED